MTVYLSLDEVSFYRDRSADPSRLLPVCYGELRDLPFGLVEGTMYPPLIYVTIMMDSNSGAVGGGGTSI